MESFDVVILGAGASGLFCAQEAAARGLRVAVLEHSPKPGRKILISGGGRANFTNLRVTPENYVSMNPHFCKSALSRFTSADFLDRIRQNGVRFVEKKHGQLFCEGTAADLLGMLLDWCRRGKVDLRTSHEIRRVESGFTVETNRGDFSAPRLVVATGGISVPRSGASDLGYRIAKQFGHDLTPRTPALCGFTLGGSLATMVSALSGVSAPIELSTREGTFREDLLFTHWGISGPAVLQASLYWNPGEPLRIRFIPELDWGSRLWDLKAKKDNRPCRAVFQEHLAERLVSAWFKHFELQSPTIQNLSASDARTLHEAWTNWELTPSDWIGWERAEVTRGGVSTTKISSKTMESALAPGLYWIGEVLAARRWTGRSSTGPRPSRPPMPFEAPEQKTSGRSIQV